MYQEHRLASIKAYLSSHKSILLEEICEMFGVSKDTARRDLVKLEERGEIIRVKGGATLPSANLINYQERKATVSKEKIALKAAAFIQDDYDLIMDTSSTIALMAKYIGNKSINVITNSIDLVDLLGENTEIDTFLLPGKFNRKNRNLTGPRTIETLNDFKVDQLFLGACGINVDGITSPDEEEAFLKKKMMSCARKVILLADCSKFEKEFLHRVCDLADIDLIITDQYPNETVMEKIRENNIRLFVVENEEVENEYNEKN
jgi:DeoR/GlpR family transcriptional regulator of sugar metabolism